MSHQAHASRLKENRRLVSRIVLRGYHFWSIARTITEENEDLTLEMQYPTIFLAHEAAHGLTCPYFGTWHMSLIPLSSSILTSHANTCLLIDRYSSNHSSLTNPTSTNLSTATLSACTLVLVLSRTHRNALRMTFLANPIF